LRSGTSFPSPSMLPLPECTIIVRFNFLTTDFCHYKGVKGFPVRLCARTNMLSDDLETSSPSSVPAREEYAATEVYYCKVNLFRMYGAERKLATDAAGVRKAHEKVCREIQKRQPKPAAYDQGGTVTRTIPVPEAAGKTSLKSYMNLMRILGQLHEKLASLQAMLLSARPVTVFSLRGDASDIPDLSTNDHAAQYKYAGGFYGDAQPTISGKYCQDETSSSSIISYPCETGLSLGPGNLSPSDNQDETHSNQQVGISRNYTEGETERYIEVLDIDPTYRPPVLQQSKSGKKHQPPSHPLSLALRETFNSSCVSLYRFRGAGDGSDAGRLPCSCISERVDRTQLG
jgi:hypothetical protein